jgi:ACS family glucarate transporter-like MFS transporter
MDTLQPTPVDRIAPQATAAHEPPSRVRWLVFALACAVSWLLYLHRYSWGVIKSAVKKETGLSDLELGWLDSAFSASYSLCQIPGGLAGDLLGPRKVLSAIILLWSACLAWLAAAHSVVGMAASRIAFGATQAGAYANLAKVTRSWFPLSMRTFAQGAIAAFAGRVGGACSSVVVATLLMGWFGLGWRSALAVISTLGILFSLAFWLLFRNRPVEHPAVNDAERQLIGGDEPPPAQVARTAKPVLIRSPANALNVAMFLLHAFTSTLPDMLYQNWIPLFLVEEKRLTSEQMGVFAMLPLVGGALGGLTGGALNDLAIRLTGNRRWSRSAIGLSGKVLSAGLIAWSVTMVDGRLVMLALFACKFFTDWSQPTQWATVTDISGPAAGTVFGMMNTVGSAAGLLAGPLIGYLIQDYGWGPMFYVMAGFYFVSGLAWLAIDCTRPLFREGVEE